MDNRLISDAELLDYLDGKSSPSIERILSDSPAFQREVAELKKMNRRFLRSFRELERPDPEIMVAVAMGHATLEQKLIVNAYLKRSEEGRAEMANLREFLSPMLPPERPRRTRLTAVLSLLTAQTRYSTGLGELPPHHAGQGGLARIQTRAREHSNWVFDISRGTPEESIRITVRALPMEGEYWQIRGAIREGANPIQGARITLRGPQPVKRTKATTSGDDGEYVLNRLIAGTYVMRLYFSEGVAELAEVTLSYE
jgi:hypothetical protein